VARLIVTNAEGVSPEARPRDVEERWILARLDATRAEFEERLPRFEFSHVANALYHLTRDEFCDWYAEAIKPRLYERDEDAVATALVALERLLKLLHPVMPHVTEEIWKHLPAREGYLIGASWPDPDPSWVESGDALDAARMAARIYRRSGVRIDVEGDARRIFENVVRPKEDGQGDIEAEVGRLRKEIARAEKMLANERFVSNAPPDVVEAEQAKLAQFQAELDALGG
jgi:valyl-tRNA synthetase